jgi:hypothetical protein
VCVCVCVCAFVFAMGKEKHSLYDRSSEDLARGITILNSLKTNSVGYCPLVPGLSLDGTRSRENDTIN